MVDFEGDIDGMLEDFGVELLFNDIPATVIFDKPDQVLFGGDALGTDYQITFKSSELSDLVDGSEVTINSEAYKVRGAPAKQSDGLITIASLSKVE